MSRILITGASGRLGAALTRDLSRDHDVMQFALVPPADAEQRATGTFLAGSVCDSGMVREAMEGVDIVVHAAAVPAPLEPFVKLMETNVLGTFVLLEEAGKSPTVRQVIFISSLSWHGLHERHGGPQLPQYLPIDEDHPSMASGYYDTSKVQGEYLCGVFARRFRKPVVALRPGWTISEDLEARFHAMPPVDRPHLNDYVGTRDVVSAVRCALSYEPPGGFEPFLLHAHDQRSTMPSLELVARWFPGIRVDRDRVREFNALVACDRARERLGWKPEFRCLRG